MFAAVTVAIGGVGWAALSALGSGQRLTNRIYTDSVVTSEAVARLTDRLNAAEEAVVYGLVASTRVEQQLTANQLESSILPAASAALANVTPRVADDPAQRALTRQIALDWTRFTRLLAELPLRGGNARTRSAVATQLKYVLDRAVANANQTFDVEVWESRRHHTEAIQAYQSNARLVIAALLSGVLLAGLLLAWEMRAVLPRVLAYSRFAKRIADGDYEDHLEIRGSDEIAVLGGTLDEVARRHRDETAYDRTQAEFSNALQLTSDERETQDLLRRHLGRTIAGATVTVINRNNSADRLEAVTALTPESPLRDGLTNAEPRSCLAVRSATVHTQADGEESLVRCAVCSGCCGGRRARRSLWAGQS